MNTLFLLMARYNAAPTIPVETVCADFFSHLAPDKFVRKVEAGEIKLPVIRMETSQKAAKHVALVDLARYLDERHAAAARELEQLSRARAGA